MESTLFDELENEFCPPLDTSLLAALLFELDNLNESQIAQLRSTLKQLAEQAIADEAINNLDTDDSEFAQETQSTSTANTTPYSSSDSAPQASFETPLGFLQQALPDVPLKTLQSALNQHSISPVDTLENTDDLWDVVASILTSEAIREMEERGLDGLDEDEAREIGIDDWNVVSNKKKFTTRKAKPKEPTTFTLGDVRHRQLGRKVQALATSDPASSSSSSSNGDRRPPPPDPWTQITSISTHLSSLLPSHPTSFFSSYFHSPDYPTPYAALTACLTSISKSQPECVDSETQEYADKLFTLLDILSTSPPQKLTSLQHTRLISETELALSATAGDADASLDLVKLLREFGEDGGGEEAEVGAGVTVGRMERGVYHLSTPAASPPGSNPTSPRLPAKKPSALPSVLPPIPVPPTVPARSSMSTSPLPPPSSASSALSLAASVSTSVKKKKPKQSPYAWQKVPSRPSAPPPHPLAPFIPAYTRDVNGRLSEKGVRLSRAGALGGGGGPRSGLGVGGVGGGYGGYGGVGEVEMRRKVQESMKRRRELLVQATRMWQRGRRGGAGRGGEVAMWFAERAREFQELARLESLNAARAMVEGRRAMGGKDGGEGSTVDLHGVTAAEAVVIVREVLCEGSGVGGSAANPLKIITGKGTHSVNQVGVLKPVVKKALVGDGWNVSSWDGGLVVRGRR